MNLTRAEAEKQIKEKPENNYYIIGLREYGNEHFVLPAKEALAVIGALSAAERLDTSKDYHSPVIIPIQRDDLIIKLLSPKEYRLRKMSALMGVDLTKEEEIEDT